MSNYKNSTAAKTTITRNTNDLYEKVDGNLFETIVLLNKRTSQIAREMKEELSQKLEEFGSNRVESEVGRVRKQPRQFGRSFRKS
ncbi:MAG: hypothetical protein RI989_1412 [Bacteroidota bacterium]